MGWIVGVSWGIPKWMVYEGHSHLEMDDLVTPFMELPFCFLFISRSPSAKISEMCFRWIRRVASGALRARVSSNTGSTVRALGWSFHLLTHHLNRWKRLDE